MDIYRHLQTLIDHKQDRTESQKTKQDSKDRTKYIQTTTPKKSFYLKLLNARTTMPRNIVASKAAVEPLNASKDKIINISTLQVELIAANTKIK